MWELSADIEGVSTAEPCRTWMGPPLTWMGRSECRNQRYMHPVLISLGLWPVWNTEGCFGGGHGCPLNSRL